MAVFIVAPKVMFTCQSEGAILYSDLYYRLTNPQRHTDINTFELFTFACVCEHAHLKNSFLSQPVPRKVGERTQNIHLGSSLNKAPRACEAAVLAWPSPPQMKRFGAFYSAGWPGTPLGCCCLNNENTQTDSGWHGGDTSFLEWEDPKQSTKKLLTNSYFSVTVC